MFAGKKSAQIREILISESAWEEMTCLFAPSLERGADSKIKGKFGWTMGNQLQRFIERGVGDDEDKDKINKIKELLIKKGGDWPPLPVEN